MTRNVQEAATHLMHADDARLGLVAKHDPDMIRDVAAALIARAPVQSSAEPEVVGEATHPVSKGGTQS